MGALFGTHGIRGRAMTEIGCETALNVGAAFAHYIKKDPGDKPEILVAFDTRPSAQPLAAAVMAGICSVGADAVMLGVLPTPALSYMVKLRRADGGVMITASDMDADYTGIKLIAPDGGRLEKKAENDIGAMVASPGEIPVSSGRDCGVLKSDSKAEWDYIRHIIKCANKYGNCDLGGLKIAVDCANGATYSTAEKLFSALGASVYLLNASPSGERINDGCGCLHTDMLSAFVREKKCHAGVSFDGDGDRCIAVDENGTVVDGDKLLAIFAGAMSEMGVLTGNGFASTVMSNLGLRHFAEKNSLFYAQTKVGDRYIHDKLRSEGLILGGEANGAITFIEDMPCADGQLTAARLFAVMAASKKPLSNLASVIERCPQVMTGVRIPVQAREIWKNDDVINETVERLTKELGSGARLVVREAGAEPIIRIMAEGRQFDAINRALLEMADIIRVRTAKYAESEFGAERNESD